MQRLTLKHLSGSRAKKLDTLTLPPEREIVFGRDPGCHVRYDEADDLVSRKHLKIVATDEEPVRFMVVDLGSRNGTFVNRQKVFGAVVLSPGEHVQLGAGGPEFEFGLEHVTAEGASPARTRPAPPTSRNGGRMRRFAWAGAAVLCLLAAGGYAAWPNMAPLLEEWRSTKGAGEVRPGFDTAAAKASTADVLAEWRLVLNASGADVVHAYVPNIRVSQGAGVPLVEGAPARLPAFVLTEDARIVPLLVAKGSKQTTRPLAGSWSAKGVFASKNGTVLAGAPLEQPWLRRYRWPQEDRAGALLVIENSNMVHAAPIATTQFPQWIPGESGFLAEDAPEELRGPVRGRWLDASDVRVALGATVSIATRTMTATVKAEERGILLAELQERSAGVETPTVSVDENGVGVKDGERVWVIGNSIEQGTILNAPAGGLMKLRSGNCHEGAVVFNQQGRALGLCVPDSASPMGGAGLAVPIELGARLLKGGSHDSSRND